MPTLLLIAAITFSTQFQCVRYHDLQSTNRPAHANITYLGMTKTIIELHGGHAVLTCRGHKFTAYILEEITMTKEAYLLSQLYGGIWADHPDHEFYGWQDEVINNYTRISYWDWVLNRIEQEENE